MVEHIGGIPITWSHSDNGIFVYDIVTKTTTQVTESQYTSSPRLGDGFMVWLSNVDVHGGDITVYRCENP
jgi:hypothetical protein